jgi:CubicO group peptidase (beta-lactamase class C family)
MGTEPSKRLAPEAKTGEAEGSFWDIPILEKAFIDTAPGSREDGLPVGKLGVAVGNNEMIVQLAKEIGDSQHGHFDSLLLVHKGKLVFESYYRRGRINLPHPQTSATKSYTSLALGRAIQLGYLTMADLDKPLISFLKDLDPSKLVEGAENITLHKALTMSSGLGITEEQSKAFEENPDKLKGQGLVQTVLENSTPITPESQVFSYGGYQPNLVMQVIDAVVPGSAKEFLETELLGKMGITNYKWHTSPSGLPESGWRVNITSRDMIKWGSLVMNKGKWNGEQLVSKAYIKRAIKTIVPLSDETAADFFATSKEVSKPGYGYFWWQAELKVGNQSYTSISAQGGGSQSIVLVEELDLMVVITGHDNGIGPLQIAADRILPAFVL